MEELRNLFIATKDKIYIGKVMFHKVLANRLDIPHSEVIGGGDFIYHRDQNVIELDSSSASYDFGKVELPKLDAIVESKEVYLTKTRKATDRYRVIW